jgi:hypothetical protein
LGVDDGVDPPPELLTRFEDLPVTLRPVSACVREGLLVWESESAPSSCNLVSIGMLTWKNRDHVEAAIEGMGCSPRPATAKREKKGWKVRVVGGCVG